MSDGNNDDVGWRERLQQSLEEAQARSGDGEVVKLCVELSRRVEHV